MDRRPPPPSPNLSPPAKGPPGNGQPPCLTSRECGVIWPLTRPGPDAPPLPPLRAEATGGGGGRAP